MMLWMKVSKDEYELPEMVCGSLSELSFKSGIKAKRIMDEIRYYERTGGHGRFLRVDIDWTEAERLEELNYYRKEIAKARKRSAIRHNWQKRYWVIQ